VAKKKEEKISVKESRSRRIILGNSNPGFGPGRGQGTRAAPCSKRCCALVLSSLRLSLPPPPSFPLPLCLSSGLVREPSHSQKTQNADGHVSRIGTEVLEGRAQGTRGEKAGGVCVCMHACVRASSGARQFTAYSLAALRRAMQRDGRGDFARYRAPLS